MQPENITKSKSSTTLAALIEELGKVEIGGLAHTFYQRHFRAILRTYDMPGNPIWPTVWKNAILSIHNGLSGSAIKVTVTPPDAKSILDMVDLVDLNIRFDPHEFVLEITMSMYTEGLTPEQTSTLIAAITGMHGFDLYNTQPGVARFTLDITRTFSSVERDQQDLISSRYWRSSTSVALHEATERSYPVDRFYAMSIRYSHVHRENVLVFVPCLPEALLEQLHDPDFFKENKIKIAPLAANIQGLLDKAEPIPFQQREAETVIQL